MRASGVANGAWKGEAAGYHAVHIWMNKHFPRTGRCEWCGGVGCVTHYAMADHSRLTRNRADWFEFCIPCHRAYDDWKSKIPSRAGIIHTAITRAKISAATRGKLKGPPSKSHREALSKALRRTHCKKGHPLNPENTYVDPRGRRCCAICKKASRKQGRR